VCDDTDCACGTQIAPVTIFGYQITMNNFVLMFVYFAKRGGGSSIVSFFLILTSSYILLLGVVVIVTHDYTQ
jgi:hypothetical protein